MKPVNRYKIYFIALAVICMIGCSYVSDPNKSANTYIAQADNNVHYKVEFSPSAATTKLIIDTINDADQSIYVAAYCLTSTSIADSLIRAHERGVDVRVVLDNFQTKHKDSKYHELLNNGVYVRVAKKYKTMHNKFMVIDNSIVETGSFNYTDNAENHNAENILMIYNNPALVQNYLDAWQKLWDESK